PARTMAGAMIRAMLAAYQRTLRATLESARSMTEVIGRPELAWLQTPDRAVAWGVALGLHGEIQTVMERNVEDIQDGRASAGSSYIPAWWVVSGGGSQGGGSGGGPSGVAPGLMASSAVPNFAGMIAAISTIGPASASSGGGGGGFGGGGFSGGSSGGF
ncbi:MAG: hypothetical protein H6Q36_1920, partial [Chloroflexi bacterium]|nr:hypothetical protein [Chloroflexota bacterium]